MWGPTTASGLGTQAGMGLPPSQPGTTPASRLADDAALLDFSDWDGPGDSSLTLCLAARHRLWVAVERIGMLAICGIGFTKQPTANRIPHFSTLTSASA